MADKALFEQFKSRIEVINLDTNESVLVKMICDVRQTHRLKLPDAIIAAFALHYQTTLVTNELVFSKVTSLPVQNSNKPSIVASSVCLLPLLDSLFLVYKKINDKAFVHARFIEFFRYFIENPTQKSLFGIFAQYLVSYANL